MRIGEETKIIYQELSYKLNGILYKAHNKLGRFCRERQYGNAIETFLKNRLFYEREKTFSIDRSSPNSNRVDFCIENKILVDVKAKKFITREDYYQMRRYLKASDLKLGIIVNFREKSLRPKRIINSEAKE